MTYSANLSKMLLWAAAACASQATLVFAQDIGVISSRENVQGALQADGYSDLSTRAVSHDGRFIVFFGEASNLVDGDNNGVSDVFIRDTVSNTTSLVSKATNNAPSNGECWEATISKTGRYVAFSCTGDSLVNPPPTNPSRKNIYLRDLQLGTTTRASLGTGGIEPNGDCSYPAASADGRYVVFKCNATNLAEGVSSAVYHVYLRDMIAGTTTLIDRNADNTVDGESFATDISSDGRYIALVSTAGNLDDTVAANTAYRHVYLYDRIAGSHTLVDKIGFVSGNGDSLTVRVSGDGSRLVFDTLANNLGDGAPDTNNSIDVYLYHRSSGLVSCESINSSGAHGNNNSRYPAISDNGRYLAFAADAGNLIAGDTNGIKDVFMRDVESGTTWRVSRAADGSQITGSVESVDPSIADSGNVAFESSSASIVAGDSNDNYDIFLAVLDWCPQDENKTTPGTCGCGVADTDTDLDGVPVCNDGCDTDPGKTAEGVCGCGQPDIDTDSDGHYDCHDLCPHNAFKSAPLQCGCDVSDDDGNGNGAPDCLDPTSDTTPARAELRMSKNKVTIGMQPFAGSTVEYLITYAKKGGQKKTVRSTAPTKTIKKLSPGNYTVTYKVRAGSVTSKSSIKAAFKIKT